MSLQTRKPTGVPPWPIILLAGREKAGKSYAAAVASASPVIGRTLWIGIGEDDPDEYALVPGADFDIVEHDGSYADIRAKVHAAAAEPPADARPTLLVIDSMTKLWDLCVDNVQAIANRRGNGKRTATGDFAISPDLWNVAKANWDDVMDGVRAHRGPVIVTARLDEVMVMENGQPTKQKTMKVQAHKSLPYDVGVVVELHERGHALITGARSVAMAIEKPEQVKGGISIPELWDRMGLTGTDAAPSTRTHSRTVVDDVSDEGLIASWTARARAEQTTDGLRALWRVANARVKRGELPPAVLDAITEVGTKRTEAASPTLDVAVPSASAAARDWVAEAEALGDDANAIMALRTEAQAAGVEEGIEQTLDSLVARALGSVPLDGGDWGAPVGAPDDWDAPAVLAAAGDAEEPI